MTIESKTQDLWRSQSFAERIISEPSFSGAEVLSGFYSESQAFLQNLDASSRHELSSLGTENNQEMFWEQMLHFAQRLESADKAEAAMQVYSVLLKRTGDFPEIQKRAQLQVDALIGTASFGSRFEIFTGRFLGEVADYRNLLPMVGCSVGFELAKAWSFGAMVNARNLPWFTKGLSANIASSLFGTMVEVPIYMGMSHGLRALSGEKTNLTSQEFWRTTLSFGALKLGAWGGASLMEEVVSAKGMATASAENLFTRFSARALPQASSLTSLWAAQALEQKLGLTDASDPMATSFDVLTTWMTWNVGGSLAQSLLGKGFAEFNGELRLRQRALLEKPPTGPGFFSAGIGEWSDYGLATANGAPLLFGEEFKAPQVAMMEAKDPTTKPLFSKGPVRAEAPEPHVLWFPSLEEIDDPKPLQYSPEMEAAVMDLETRIQKDNQRLDAPVSVAVLKRLSKYDSEALLKRERNERILADRIWEYQGKDFARSLGASVEILGPERLLEPILPGDKTLPEELLKKAAAKLAEPALNVLEMVIPAAEIYVGRGNEETVYTDFNTIMQSMQACLGNKVRLIGVNKEAGMTTLRIPSLSLLERLLRQSQGEQATPFHFVWGEIPRDPIMLLRGLGIAPVGFSRDPLWLGDLKINVHPWFFTWHDLYHAFASSMLPPSLREFAAWLYGFNLQKILPKFKIAEGHLDRLSDLAMPPGSYEDPGLFLDYSMIFVWKIIQDQIEKETLTYEKFLHYRHYLDSYRKALAKQSPQPKFVDWHQGALSAVERSLKKFDEIILETIKAMPSRTKKP